MHPSSDAARILSEELGTEVRPREISDLFYERKVPELLGPMIGGRRLIDSKDVLTIKEALLASRNNKAKGQHDGDRHQD